MYENDTQSKKQLAAQLNESLQSSSKRLYAMGIDNKWEWAMGKIQNIGKWIPHELNNARTRAKSLLRTVEI